MTPASERKKRQRARERNGEIIAPVTVNNCMIETLIDLRLLDEGESEDRKQIGCAITALLDDLAVSHRQKLSVTRGHTSDDERGSIGATNFDHEDHR